MKEVFYFRSNFRTPFVKKKTIFYVTANVFTGNEDKSRIDFSLSVPEMRINAKLKWAEQTQPSVRHVRSSFLSQDVQEQINILFTVSRKKVANILSWQRVPRRSRPTIRAESEKFELLIQTWPQKNPRGGQLEVLAANRTVKMWQHCHAEKNTKIKVGQLLYLTVPRSVD